jgi:hypothetical protein
VLLANESRLLATKEGNAKGFEYANNAIALDPTLASAYACRGWLNYGYLWVTGLDPTAQAAEFPTRMIRQPQAPAGMR